MIWQVRCSQGHSQKIITLQMAVGVLQYVDDPYRMFSQFSALAQLLRPRVFASGHSFCLSGRTSLTYVFLSDFGRSVLCLNEATGAVSIFLLVTFYFFRDLTGLLFLRDLTGLLCQYFRYKSELNHFCSIGKCCITHSLIPKTTSNNFIDKLI